MNIAQHLIAVAIVAIAAAKADLPTCGTGKKALGVMCKNKNANEMICTCPAMVREKPVECTTWISFKTGGRGHDYCAYKNCLKDKAICGGKRLRRIGKCCDGFHCQKRQQGKDDRFCAPNN